MNIISKFLLIIFLFLLFETKSYSQASGDSTEITIDSITTKVEIYISQYLQMILWGLL